MPIASGSDTLSQELFAALTAGLDLSLDPLPDLTTSEFAMPAELDNDRYGEISAIDNAALTTGVLEGTGVFDLMMRAVKAHLKVELTAGRITGDQYTKAYVATTTQALQTAVAFLLGRDQAYWQNLLLQSQAQAAQVGLVTERVKLAIAKVELQQAHAQAEVQNQLSAAQYALQKLNLSIGDQEYILKGLQQSLTSGEITLKGAQKLLVDEQIEVQRAQTLDTRSDGITQVSGSVGKQKELYDQQIDSYQKDARYKVGKALIDTWIAQKTLDEALTPPNEMTNATLETVINSLRTDNGLT